MKLAIIGTGKIVTEALKAIEPVSEICVSAIYARPHSREKGEAFAQQYAIPEVYTDYEALLDEADIDTVYIGLINSAHYPYAKRALEKKMNVILEKPFTGTLPEAEDLIRLAREKDRFVFEAMTVMHNDICRKMREDLPKLGKIRMMLANFSQYSSRYDSYVKGEVSPAFDPACAGGALMDLNVYNIYYAVTLFGAPAQVRYFPNRGFNGVDTSGTLVMEYDGFSAVCTAAKDSDSPSFVCIQGEKGYLKIDGKPNISPNLTTVLADETREPTIRDAAGILLRPTVSEPFTPRDEHRMTREFRDFVRIIDSRDYGAAEALMTETLTVMRILADALSMT